MSKFNKFMRSKNGKIVLGALALVFVVAIIVFVGLEGGMGGLTGTAGIPSPSYPMPASGYTCLPTCEETDAKMFVLAGSNQFSMSNTPIIVWVMVPGDQQDFRLGIFDGDTSLNADNTLILRTSGKYAGTYDSNGGNWDNAYEGDTTYTLYADPLADGSGQTVLNSWMGNEHMLNNAWWETSIGNVDQAKAPNGHYYYRLEATRPLDARGAQAFKVRASGHIMTGQGEQWAVGLVGMLATYNDLKIVYPESTGLTNLGNVATYDGDWQLYFYLPNRVSRFELWDGDFDYGAAVETGDTKDPNTDEIPYWATDAAVMERAAGPGRPNEDNSVNYLKVSPAVSYELIDPEGNPIYINNDPSGTEEWEKFVISMDAGETPEFLIDEPLKPGMYNIRIKGLDLHNFVWFSANYQMCTTEGCPPPVWTENSCPRTIGYWKNNVKKISENKPRGTQETKESLEWGLRNVALASKLYRSGLNAKNPSEIANPTPLTLQEADAILQRKGDNSMLARALQQNLATWMNLATGKIGATSQVEIKGITGGDFSGTMMEALLWSEDVILDPAKRSDPQLLERAKDIADMINNNAITTDATEDKESEICYPDKSMPKDKQPPAHKDMPKAPKPQAPKNEPSNEAPVCTAGNLYNVENTTNNPFYSVKFEFIAGSEVKNGAMDTFRYTLPSDVVASMSEMQVEVKASTDSRTYDLFCDFTSSEACGLPVGDDTYAVSFDGAQDNGDGTYTLTFTIYVYGDRGLSHVSFSLPEGQFAGGLDEGSYTSGDCVP